MSLAIIFIYLNLMLQVIDIESQLLKRKEITKFDLKIKF